jgi:hypothetical protein
MAEGALDLSNALNSIDDKIKSSRTFVQVKQDSKKLQQDIKNNLEQAKDKTTTSVNKLKDQKKRYQRQVKSQIDNLLSIIQFNMGSGPSTMNYIKSKFIEIGIRIGPKISPILLEESIKALGCSQQQAYDTSQAIYIKVKSTDLQNLLKRNPSEPVAAVAYEKTPPAPGALPYSMNREMWDRLQQVNTPVDFYGASAQKLFEISYVQQDGNGVSGDFYKIVLANKITGINTVFDFLVDYYSAIKIVDISNLFQQLMDLICGAMSIEANIGTGEIDIKNKFALLIQRILGLCFDSKKEIDVTGNSKVAELDGIDESFFDFTDIDLRYIDQITSDIKLGVVEFEECQTVKLPVDSTAILNGLLKFNDAKDIDAEKKIANSLTDLLTDNPAWKLKIPNSVDIKLAGDLSFLTNLPKAIMLALLSPKVVLPLLIMAKAIGQLVGDTINSLLDFIKVFKTYVIALMSKIGGIFVKELFEIIKKDIKQLMSDIIADIMKEKAAKRIYMILRLIELILLIARFIDDWRKCKSVLDEILAILKSISGMIGMSLPPFLVAASEALPGASASRGFMNAIEEFQKLGLPTGQMPDGSPNLMLQSVFSGMKGAQKEEDENGKVQVFIKPLTITPAGITIPSGDMYGKKM